MDSTSSANNKIRLPLKGARLNRLYARFLIFVGMMAMFSLTFGLSSGVTLYGAAVFLVLCGVIVFLFFRQRDKREDRRVSQLSEEAIESCPDPSSEALCAAYEKLRRRELRVEACFYFILAAIAFLWVLLLSRYSEGAYFVGFYGVVPVLLLIGLALFVFSFFYRTNGIPSAWLEKYLNDPEKQRIMCDRAVRPDHRRDDKIVEVIAVDRLPSFEEACEITKTAARAQRRTKVFALAYGFFFWLPAAMFLFSLLLTLGGGPSYLPILFGFIMLVGALVMAALVKMDYRVSLKKKTIRMASRAAKNGRLSEERLLSVVPSPDEVSIFELCFSESGTYRFFTKDTLRQGELPSWANQRATMLLSGGRALAAFITVSSFELQTSSEESDALPVPESTSNPADDAAPITQDVAETSASLPKEAADVDAAVPALDSAAARKASAKGKPSGKAPVIEDEALADLMRIVEQGALPSDEQIAEAGHKRIESMDPLRKKQLTEMLCEFFDLSDIYRANSFKPSSRKTMTPAQEQRYFEMDFNLASLRTNGPSGSLCGFESSLIQQKNLSREQLRGMKKNPYSPFNSGVFRPLLIVALVSLVGIPVSALITKNTGADLSWLTISLSSVSGLFSLYAGRAIVSSISDIRSFRKLQKAYDTPEFWNDMIERALYNEMYDQANLEREDRNA